MRTQCAQRAGGASNGQKPQELVNPDFKFSDFLVQIGHAAALLAHGNTGRTQRIQHGASSKLRDTPGSMFQAGGFQFFELNLTQPEVDESVSWINHTHRASLFCQAVQDRSIVGPDSNRVLTGDGRNPITVNGHGDRVMQQFHVDNYAQAAIDAFQASPGGHKAGPGQ